MQQHGRQPTPEAVLERIERSLHSIYEKLEQTERSLRSIYERLDIIMASQADNQAQLDALTGRVQALDTTLQAVKTAVDALKNQPGGQALDFSQVDSALSQDESDAAADLADAGPTAPTA